MIFTRKIETTPDKPTVLLIHGLYSSSSNWYAIARALDCNVIMVDLPNHGRSEWVDEFSYRSLADAIAPLIDKEMYVVGHSLGGRIATILAAENRLIKGLVVVDISPITDRKTDRIFTMCHSLFMQHLVEARRTGVEDIQSYLQENGVAEDMCSAVDQAYRQMNIEVVAEKLSQLPKQWNEIMSCHDKITTRTLFVRGGASPYITDEVAATFSSLFTNYSVATVQGGSHRLHHEYPERFVEIVKEFIG